jgi:hypothetical protein
MSKPKVTKAEGWKIDDNGNVYKVKPADLFSESQIAQIATWRGMSTAVPINGRKVECKRISVYKDHSRTFRDAIPRTTPQYVVIRLDNGKKVKPSPEMFTVKDPGPGR